MFSRICGKICRWWLGKMFNILTQPLIRANDQTYTLPGVLAALARDEVERFPALRPHQGPSWYMFLVQLAGIALCHSGSTEVFKDEQSWLKAIRNLTSQFSSDEPWCLVVDDWSLPAFLQPPVPEGVLVEKPVPTPDALDLLITAKNHDLKRAIVRNGEPDDWLFALISLQTGEGYGGKGNQGIARMNGGSSSRPMVALAPLPADQEKIMHPRFGARFQRDVSILLETYESEINGCNIPYAEKGIGLTWVEPWAEGDQLQVKNLDMWFIEVCRRIRLKAANGLLFGFKGNSIAPRIDAKNFKGCLNDPFAPVYKTGNKSLTISFHGFNYTNLVEILFSGDWILPLLARVSSRDSKNSAMCLIAESIARGNSTTDGFHSRILPISTERLHKLSENREQINKIAKLQCSDANNFKKALGFSLALVSARGDSDKLRKEHYQCARETQNHFDQAVDGVFFKHLWSLLEAQELGEDAFNSAQLCWSKILYGFAQTLFDVALPSVPCAGSFRPRAESRARRSFTGIIRHHYPELFGQSEKKGEDHVA